LILFMARPAPGLVAGGRVPPSAHGQNVASHRKSYLGRL